MSASGLIRKCPPGCMSPGHGHDYWKCPGCEREFKDSDVNYNWNCKECTAKKVKEAFCGQVVNSVQKRKAEAHPDDSKEKKQRVLVNDMEPLLNKLTPYDLHIGQDGDWVLPWQRGSEIIVPLGDDFPVDDHGHKCFKQHVNDEIWGTLMNIHPVNQHGMWSFSIKVTNPPSGDTMCIVRAGLPYTIRRGDVVTIYSKTQGGLASYGVCETPAQSVISAQLVDLLLKRQKSKS